MQIRSYQWSSKNEADIFRVTNPATGETIALIQGGGASEVDSAVRAAHAAFHGQWRFVPGRVRGGLLLAVADRLRTCAEEIALLESSENGKPLVQARRDVESCIASFSYFGGLAGKMPGEFFDSHVVYGAAFLEPYGVVAAIIPFNWPPIHTGGKAAPALAVGNTLVVKPPEQTPLTVMRILEIAQEVLPPGVIQVVPGHGPAAGMALSSHPLVSKISFTGATRTGAAVVRQSADNTTPTLLELGGKNGLLVLEDADLDLVLKAALEAGYYNQGEACTAGSRIIVHRSLHRQLVQRLGAAVERLKVGHGRHAETHVGPLISAQHRDRVLGYLALAQREGATIAAQASLPDDSECAGGYFVAPTLVDNVTRDMRIAQEEIFGPVVCVLPFDEEVEAVDIANATPYGLTAAVFTARHPVALRIARQLDVGMVFVNNYFRSVAGMPFGGIKGSGYGREHTLQTMKEYGRTKLITFASGLAEIPVWDAVHDTGL